MPWMGSATAAAVVLVATRIAAATTPDVAEGAFVFTCVQYATGLVGTAAGAGAADEVRRSCEARFSSEGSFCTGYAELVRRRADRNSLARFCGAEYQRLRGGAGVAGVAAPFRIMSNAAAVSPAALSPGGAVVAEHHPSAARAQPMLARDFARARSRARAAARARATGAVVSAAAVLPPAPADESHLAPVAAVTSAGTTSASPAGPTHAEDEYEGAVGAPTTVSKALPASLPVLTPRQKACEERASKVKRLHLPRAATARILQMDCLRKGQGPAPATCAEVVRLHEQGRAREACRLSVPEKPRPPDMTAVCRVAAAKVVAVGLEDGDAFEEAALDVCSVELSGLAGGLKARARQGCKFFAKHLVKAYSHGPVNITTFCATLVRPPPRHRKPHPSPAAPTTPSAVVFSAPPAPPEAAATPRPVSSASGTTYLRSPAAASRAEALAAAPPQEPPLPQMMAAPLMQPAASVSVLPAQPAPLPSAFTAPVEAVIAQGAGIAASPGVASPISRGGSVGEPQMMMMPPPAAVSVGGGPAGVEEPGSLTSMGAEMPTQSEDFLSGFLDQYDDVSAAEKGEHVDKEVQRKVEKLFGDGGGAATAKALAAATTPRPPAAAAPPVQLAAAVTPVKASGAAAPAAARAPLPRKSPPRTPMANPSPNTATAFVDTVDGDSLAGFGDDLADPFSAPYDEKPKISPPPAGAAPAPRAVPPPPTAAPAAQEAKPAFISSAASPPAAVAAPTAAAGATAGMGAPPPDLTGPSVSDIDSLVSTFLAQDPE